MKDTAVQAQLPTPNRVTSASFDITETVATEVGFSFHRKGEQMDPVTTTNVTRLTSGVWILKPVNDLDVIHETTVAQTPTMRLSDFTASGAVYEAPRQRLLTELTGIDGDAGVATSGDYFFGKRVTASEDWDRSLVDGVATSPTAATANYPLDLMLTCNVDHDPETGYILRLLVPGSLLQTPDRFFGFRFGGPLIGEASSSNKGYGDFFLSLYGDGKVTLHEAINAAWVLKKTWRFADPGRVSREAITIRILPHASRWIEFAMLSAGIARGQVYGWGGNLDVHRFQWAFDHANTVGTYLHEVDDRRRLGPPAQGGVFAATGRGRPQVWVRRDIQMLWHVSRLVYPASGTLVDKPFSLPQDIGTDHVLQIVENAWATFVGDPPVQKTLVAGTAQAADGTALTTGNENYTWAGTTKVRSGWLPPGGSNRCRVSFAFTNSESAPARWHTPVLFGYLARRNPHTQSHAPGVKTGGTLTHVSVTGPGYQPEHETATLVIEDLGNALSFLRDRGRASVRLETTYDPADQTKKCVLFEGYTNRVLSERRGVIKTNRLYPSQNWHRLNVSAVGKWDKLSGRFFQKIQENFTNPAESPSQETAYPVNRGWKITDIIRHVLYSEGIPDSQVDLFDSDIRILQGFPNETKEMAMPMHGTSIPDYLEKLARDYLNAFFVWDANAGSAGGMFRLLRPPVGTETAVWAFVTTRPTAGRLAHFPGAYGSSTSPILTRMETYIVPPEGNVLFVCGFSKDGHPLPRTLFNATSYNAPNHAATASVSDPDYLGRVIPIELINPVLDTQQIVDWAAYRIFQLSCRGRKFVQFIASLPLLDCTAEQRSDGTGAAYPSRERRLLRPGDTVTIDGTRHIIHSCNPEYSKDGVQMAFVECELYRSAMVFN